MIATPDGHLSRYFYGVDYAPRDLRLGLVEASARQNRQPGGPDSAVLLSLRSGHRQVRRRRHEYRARRRRRCSSCSAAFSCSSLIRRERRARPSRKPWYDRTINRYGQLPLSISGSRPLPRSEVDHSVVLPAGGGGLLHVADFRARSSTSPSATGAAPSANCRTPVHGGMALEIVWSVIPFGLTMVMFSWGASIFFTRKPSAG